MLPLKWHACVLVYAAIVACQQPVGLDPEDVAKMELEGLETGAGIEILAQLSSLEAELNTADPARLHVFSHRDVAIQLDADKWHDIAVPYYADGCAISVFNRAIYIVGGMDQAYDVQVYAGQEWIYYEAILAHPRIALATVVYRKRLYAIGGQRLNQSSSVVCLARDTWGPAPGLHTPRYGHDAIAYNDRIFVAGGRAVKDGKLVTSVELYDGKVWTTIEPQDSFGMATLRLVVFKRRLHALCTVCHDGFKVWSIKQQNWQPSVIPLPAEWEEASGFAAVTLKSGLHLLGGRLDDDPSAEHWVYDGTRWREATVLPEAMGSLVAVATSFAEA